MYYWSMGTLMWWWWASFMWFKVCLFWGVLLGWDSYMVTSFKYLVLNIYFILKIPRWKVLYFRILKNYFILFQKNYINYFIFSGNEIISVEVASVLWYWCLCTSCTEIFIFFFNFLMVHWERNLALYDNMFLEPVRKVKKNRAPKLKSK